jgi:MerR family transcriptional regulator, copper efflux regulator
MALVTPNLYHDFLMHQSGDQTTGGRLMTVGELARRTGMSAKAIRQFEGLGLIYSAGRSEANYRLFDQSAIWCIQVIGSLRSLGLTIKEIQQLAAVYLDRPGEPIGPRLAELLDRAEQRIAQRREELDLIQRRIRDFRDANSDALAGRTELTDGDLRRRRAA